jgi:hypothetical protein
MANTLLTTNKIIDTTLPTLVVGTTLIEIANKMLMKGAYSDAGNYGIGSSVEMRKAPRYFASSIDISNPNVALNLTSQNIQQETITITTERLTYGNSISLTAVETALQMQTQQAFNDYVMTPMMESIKQKIVSYIYDKLLDNLYYIVGSDSSLVNNYQTIADARTAMKELNIPGEYCLVMSPRDMGAFSSNYVQSNFNKRSIDSIWDNGYIGRIDGFMVYEDENIRLHRSGTASSNTGITIGTAMSNGDTNITLAGLTVGDTINVKDILKISTSGDGADVYFVSPYKEEVDNTYLSPAFVVDADNTGSNSDYDSSTQTYTASDTTMTVSVKQPLRTETTSDQYATIYTPTGQLISGIGVTVVGNHRLNFAMPKNAAIYFAAPPLPILDKGMVTVRKSIDSVSINCSTQDILATYSSNFVPLIQYGCEIAPEYVVGIVSGQSSSNVSSSNRSLSNRSLSNRSLSNRSSSNVSSSNVSSSNVSSSNVSSSNVSSHDEDFIEECHK